MKGGVVIRLLPGTGLTNLASSGVLKDSANDTLTITDGRQFQLGATKNMLVDLEGVTT